MKELILKNKLLAIIIGVIVVIGGGTAAFFLLKEEKDNYVVKFEGAEISKIEVMEGNYLKEPENPTKDGYKFVGWYLNGELFDFSKPIEGNITLEARWEKSEKEEIPEMTAELAAQLFDEYKNTHFENPEEYEYKNITVNAKGDNHSYLIGYDEYHQGEELGNVGVIIQYKDGSWDFSLPGSSGFIESELEKYNFVWLNDDTEEIPEMTAELAAQLFDEYKNTHFENPEEYEYKNITVNAKGDNHSYLIGYDEYHQGEELGNVGVIMQYKDGSWDFSLPGSSGFIESELEKYNFVWYE